MDSAGKHSRLIRRKLALQGIDGEFSGELTANSFTLNLTGGAVTLLAACHSRGRPGNASRGVGIGKSVLTELPISGVRSAWIRDKYRDVAPQAPQVSVFYNYSLSTVPSIFYPYLGQIKISQAMTDLNYKPTRSASTNSHSNRKHTTTHTRSTSHSLSLPTAKMFRSRSKSPAPIDTGLDSHSQNYSTSPTQMSPTDLHRPAYGKRASDSSYSSYSSHSRSHSSSTSHPQPHRRSSDDYRRLNGTVNHHGRHSNDWLFGGFSLRDTVKDGVDKLKSHVSERAD